MVLVCPNCSSRFKVKPEALGEKGRLVRCANCGHKWHASVDDLQESVAAKSQAATKAAPKKDAPRKAAAPKQAPAAKPAPAPKPAPAAKPAEPPAAVEPPADSAPPEEVSPVAPPSEPKAEPDFAGEDALAHLDRDEDQGEAEEDVPPTSAAEEFDGPPPPIPPASHFEPREPETKSKGPLISWLALGAFVILFVVGLWLFAKPLVEAYPPAAAVYRMVGAEIDLLGHGFELPQPVAEAHPDKTPRTLVVKGVVENTTGDTMTIPLLKGSLRDSDGADLATWVFRASREEALPSESVPYETETSNIPQGATTVAVTFLTEEEAHEQGLLTEEGHEQGMETEEQSHQ